MTRLTLTFSLLALSACAPKDGGQVGEETVVCKPVETQSLAVDQDSPLGFSAMDILDFADGSHTETLRWADGTETELTTSFSFENTANFHVREWVDDSMGGGPEPALDMADCPDIVEMSMTVSMSTADGELNESWLIDLQAASVDSATFYQDLSTAEGTIMIDRFAPTGDHDSYRAFLDLTINATGITGTISGQAEGSDGETAFAQNYDIASFGLDQS